MSNPQEVMQAKVARVDESHRLRAGRSALLVVDMQHGFLDEGASLEVPAGRAVIPNIKRLIDACRASKVPVIFTEFVYAETVPCLRGEPFGLEHLPANPDAPPEYGVASANCLIGPNAGQGAESSKTIDELMPRDDELVVEAHTYDKFYGTPLDLALRSLNVSHLMISGVTTDVCVNSTLIAAAMRNYYVTAATDGMATIHDHIQKACFQIWQNKFARLKAADELLVELSAIGG